MSHLIFKRTYMFKKKDIPKNPYTIRKVCWGLTRISLNVSKGPQGDISAAESAQRYRIIVDKSVRHIKEEPNFRNESKADRGRLIGCAADFQ